MNLHQQLVSPDQTGGKLYQEAIFPLARFHQALPEIHYLYTIIEKDNKRYFILDTAYSRLVNRNNTMESSHVMEQYDDSAISDDWLIAVRKVVIFVDSSPYTDKFGTFISSSVPLFDSHGNYSGILGIDIDADTFYSYRKRLIINSGITCLMGLTISTMTGFLKYRSEKYSQELRKLERDLITTDHLTGAYNRRFYDELSNREWNRFKRYKSGYSVTLFDIDFFKNINDTYGHDIGDQVLINLVRNIQGIIRDTDFLIRMGGEEFLVFMPDTLEDDALIIANRINKSVAQNSMDLGEHTLVVTVSAGVSCIRDNDNSVEEIYKRADVALYNAKKEGRNRVKL